LLEARRQGGHCTLGSWLRNISGALVGEADDKRQLGRTKDNTFSHHVHLNSDIKHLTK